MKHNSHPHISFIIALALIIGSCQPKAPEEKLPDAAFMEYITAYTGGVVSSASSVDIHFNAAILGDIRKESDTDLASLFRFSPAMEGKAYWTQDNVLSFTPSSPMASGQKYEVTFDLGKIIQVREKLRKFPFSFEVIRQSFTVSMDGIYSEYEDYGIVAARGEILFADAFWPENVEEMLRAEYEGREMKIRWHHLAGENKSRFVIDSVARAEDEQFLRVNFSGKPLGLDEKGEVRVSIPSKNKFEVTQVRVAHTPEQFVTVLFSDPLSVEQSLLGLISIDGAGEVRLMKEKNELRVYPPSRLQGNRTLRIDGSLKSIFGKPLVMNQQLVISFDALYPAVKFLSSGTILPSTDRLVIPFQAVNLSAVDIRVIRIFEDNVPQFLQINRIENEYELNRVGRPVIQKKIELKSEKPIDYGQWNTFFLDVSEIIRVEPGAVYNLQIRFSRDYSLFPCNQETSSVTASNDDEDEYYGYYEEGEEDFDWDEPGYYYERYYPRGYRWKEANNPCHISYYYLERFVSRNILASNLGMIAKAGSDGKYTVAVTDLLTTAPVSGASLELLNFQQQVVARAKTNARGTAEIEAPGKAFLLVADYMGQKGYLKLDDGASLSLSKFNVQGDAVREGLKGFIYGDRGVWRPGDTLFLMFIMEDENKRLPADHPVNFELIDPSGQVIQTQVKTSGTNGFYNFTTSTPEDARTGFYQARVSVGNVTFSKSLRIETIKPNRLKIDLTFPKEVLTNNGATTPATLSARWLHGGTATGLKATVTRNFRKKTADFKDFRGFVFEDPGKELQQEEKVIFENKMDATGKAVIQVETGGNMNAPGLLSANFQVKVFEPSGEFSIDQVSVPYVPYPRLVGIKVTGLDKWGFARSDSAYRCELVPVDAEGKPVHTGNLNVMIYRMEWRWWWNSGGSDLASYFTTAYRNPVITDMAPVRSGRGIYTIQTQRLPWGRYFIKVTDPQGGHSAGMEFYVRGPVRWDPDSEEGREFATMLEFTSDKEKYNIGDKATITIPTGNTGKALITLENGSQVLRSEWVDITGNTTKYTFTITPEMAPNVYAFVTLIQPHAQALNDLPMRLYGVIPIMAEDPATILKPVIKSPEEIRPEEKYTLYVREEKGKAMTYTLAVVDEGLLDLTRFKTPDPWARFFAKEALGVKTWDMFDQVIGAFGGKLERVLAVGGDGSQGPVDKAKVNRFKPVVQFIGPITLKPGEEKAHTLTMPNYVGSVRVMVVAANDYPAYGMAEKAIPVKQPVMVLATLPRVLGPGEKVKLPVNVFMMEDGKNEVRVTVQTNEMLAPAGETEKKARFSGKGEQLVEFDLEVAAATGTGTVLITAVSGKEKATYRFEIEVRNPNPPVKQHYFTKLEGGKEWRQDLGLVGLKGSNSVRMEVSSLISVDLARHLEWLTGYPYGCAEQITSKAFPQLFLGDLSELSPEQKNRIAFNIKSTIDQFSRFQNTEGSFNFWPDQAAGNDYITSYLGHFLVEAGKKGYGVPAAMMKSWRSYQKSAAGRWDSKRDDDLVQAYHLYTLALAGEPQLGAMNKLREQPKMSEAAKSCLASAYALAGQKEAARKVFEIPAPDRAYESYYYSYGSPLRDRAMRLEALMYLEEDEEASKLAFEIAGEFGKDMYFSTQTTAYVLQALSKFTQKHRADKQLKYTYSLGNEPAATVTSPFNLDLKEWKDPQIRGEAIRVINEGQGDLFIRMTVKGTPLTDNQPSEERNLKLGVVFQDMQGNRLDPSSLRQGTDFKALVTVTLSNLPRGQDNLALAMIFPSGWEIIRRSVSGFDAEYTGKEYDYQDIRDDRVYTFFHLGPGQGKTFTFFLNATYQGTFFMPAASCEAMYDDGIFSRLAGKWIKVIPSE